MRVRLKDIARDLNVSVVTVSKVLRNHRDISPATKELVLKRMKELNYQPNWAARTLVTGRTFTIGLVVPDLVHNFFAEVAKGIVRVIRPKGYSLIISSSSEDADLERHEISHMAARQVDALIIASVQTTPDAFDEATRLRIPIILVDRKLPGINARFIGVNDQEIGFLATEHLIQSGYRRIAHISGPDISPSLGRLAGYKQALEHYQIPVDPDLIAQGSLADDAIEQGGFEAMQALLARQPRPDAVFSFNDAVALGAMRAVLDAGLQIPNDVAFAGAGNSLYSDFLRIPLTSVDQQSQEVGQRAAQAALEAVESATGDLPPDVLLKPSLVVRESSTRRG